MPKHPDIRCLRYSTHNPPRRSVRSTNQSWMAAAASNRHVVHKKHIVLYSCITVAASEWPEFLSDVVLVIFQCLGRGSRRNWPLQFCILRSLSNILSNSKIGPNPEKLCQNQKTYPCQWVWSDTLVTAGPVGQLRAVNLLAGHVCSDLLCWWPQLEA